MKLLLGIGNPDRMPRRITRLLSAVDRSQLELCPSESAALKREAELLLEIKPRFNRAGVWKAPPRHLVWRAHPRGLELEISPEPAADWNRLGPLGGHVVLLRRSLVRLLWCLHHPERGLAGMPPGWFRGELPPDLLVPAPTPRLAHESSDLLAGLNRGDVTRLQSKLSAPGSRFEQVVRELDLEIVSR